MALTFESHGTCQLMRTANCEPVAAHCVPYTGWR